MAARHASDHADKSSFWRQARPSICNILYSGRVKTPRYSHGAAPAARHDEPPLRFMRAFPGELDSTANGFLASCLIKHSFTYVKAKADLCAESFVISSRISFQS
jgi:hypothetical protein